MPTRLLGGVAVAALALSLAVHSQSVDSHVHSVPTLVKGSEHPEKVSDNRAWLTQLLVGTSLPSDSERLKAAAAYNRRAAGLASDGAALDEFRARHDSLVSQYNEDVKGVNDPVAIDDAQAQLYASLDQLIREMVAYFQRNHSEAEFAEITRMIEESKKNISFATRDDSPAALEPSVYHAGHARLVLAQFIYNQYGTAGYSQYASLYTDGTNYYQTVYVYGASNVTWTCTWTQIGQYNWAWEPPGCNPSGPPIHSFSVSNQINGSGPNNASLGGYSAPTYVNLSNSNQAPIGAGDGTLSAGFRITCPIAGAFFDPFFLLVNVRPGKEYVAWTGVRSGAPPLQDCYVTSACANSRPWVVDLPYVIAEGYGNYCAPAYTCWGVCVRAAPGYPWTCTTNPLATLCFKLSEGPPNPPQRCTPAP